MIELADGTWYDQSEYVDFVPDDEDDYEEENDVFNELSESHKALAVTREEERGNRTADIIANNDLYGFSQYAMTREKREMLSQMKYVTDGLFVEGYHTYLYGASGSGKTTILLNLCFEIVARGYTVYFFYLDGELFSASKVSEKIDNENLQDKYQILTDGTMQDYMEILQKLIDKKESLRNTVFILDTFKFLSDDVNNKNANKKAMHFIKDVCNLGATFISLGHTNKDGKNQSGTAEIEQDSDALLRIDSIENSSKIISTIQKGGRCRCTIEERSFEFECGNPLSVASLKQAVDVEGIKLSEMKEREDFEFINQVLKLLLDGEKSQSNLLEEMKDFGIGKNKMMKKLKSYIGKKWGEKKGDKNASIYFLIDDIIMQ